MPDDLRPPFRIQFDNARDPYTARNALGIQTAAAAAPTSAQYITAATDPTLTAERVLTNTATITWDFTTPGQAKASSSGAGNVSNSGTPTSGQYGKWVTATTIQGVAAATVLSDIGAQPAGSYQPLDGDLTSLAAAAGTNTIYYRSAASTWSAVTVGTGLTFAGGTLAATAGSAITNIAIQKFTASGTYTPTSGMKFCSIECIGSGGGGGGAVGTAAMFFSGAGGGSGGYSKKLATAATIGASQSVTIGSNGLGGAAGANPGTAAGDTSVGTICIAKGGGGGQYASSGMTPTPGAGGIAGTGDVTAAGAPGQGGFYSQNNAYAAPSGMGGSSVFGGGGMAVFNANGISAGNYGSGGGGGSVSAATNASGGHGSTGIVIITEYI